jgi:hypothetical protein
MTVGMRVEKRGCSSCTRSCYVFTTYKERERERLHTGVKHRNSNDVASFCSPRLSSSSTCRSTRMCWEVVVVVVVVIIMVMVVAGAQNKKKKGQKKRASKAAPTCV